jgi:hypothetical protein
VIGPDVQHVLPDAMGPRDRFRNGLLRRDAGQDFDDRRPRPGVALEGPPKLIDDPFDFIRARKTQWSTFPESGLPVRPNLSEFTAIVNPNKIDRLRSGERRAVVSFENQSPAQ